MNLLREWKSWMKEQCKVWTHFAVAAVATAAAAVHLCKLAVAAGAGAVQLKKWRWKSSRIGAPLSESGVVQSLSLLPPPSLQFLSIRFGTHLKHFFLFRPTLAVLTWPLSLFYFFSWELCCPIWICLCDNSLSIGALPPANSFVVLWQLCPAKTLVPPLLPPRSTGALAN